MKTTRLLLAAALLASLTSLSFAGPGIDYWNRMSQNAKNRPAAPAKATNDAKAATQPAAPAAACVACSCSAKKG